MRVKEGPFFEAAWSVTCGGSPLKTCTIEPPPSTPVLPQKVLMVPFIVWDCIVTLVRT